MGPPWAKFWFQERSQQGPISFSSLVPLLNRSSQLTIHSLIHTLAGRLEHYGVATRAQAIFDFMMQRTSIKWGKAAKLAAGAAVVFAMREQGRGDRTHYVAVSSSSFPFSVDTIAPPGQFPCCLTHAWFYCHGPAVLQHGFSLGQFP